MFLFLFAVSRIGRHSCLVRIHHWMGVLYMAWVRDQVYVFAYKGNTSARCVGAREGRRGKGGSWGESSGAFQDPFRRLCWTLSDMLTDRQADARTNLSSIRPMHFKLIVLRARGIPPLFFGPRLVKGRWNNRAGCWKVCTRSYFRLGHFSPRRAARSAPVRV